MKIELVSTGVDPRIYDVTINFTGYPKDIKYFPLRSRYYSDRLHTVPYRMLDELLKPLKLRRISYWHSVRPDSLRKRTNIYRTTVISDRMNKRNDVG